MYEILKQINDTVFIGYKDGMIYTLKKIHLEDSDIYKKLMSIDNDNIARVIELTVEDGDFFAVCEYVNGVTIRQKFEKDGAFSDDEVKRIITAVCTGLESVHNAGLVHRDITPNNIMLTDDGKVKIIDFGISRIRKYNASADTEILGTHGYAAPEQYGFGQTSAKTDIYAVGALINYMKTGALPNEKSISGSLGKIVEKCTRMDENERYENIRKLKWDINGRGFLRHILSYVPGFGKGILYRELLACIYYICSAAFVLFIAFGPSADQEIRVDSSLPIFIAAVLFVPVPFIGNAGNWQEKWKYTARKSPLARFFISLLISIIILAFVFVLLMIL